MLDVLVSVAIYAVAVMLSEESDEPTDEEPSRARARARARTARRLGLTHHAATASALDLGRLEGEISGCRVRVWDLVMIEPFRVSVHTRYEVGLPSPLGLGLYLQRDDEDRSRRPLGARDLQIGAPTFDRLHWIEARSAERVARFLTPGRRKHVRRVLASNPGAFIEDERVVFQARRTPEREETMGARIEQLVRLALQLSPRAPDEREEAAHGPRRRSRSARRRRASRQGYLRLEPSALVAQLFRPGVPTAQAARRYERRYHGRRARLRGDVVSLESRRVDPTFGDVPTLRVTLSLRGRSPDEDAGRSVRAVLLLAPEQESELRRRRGDTLVAEGTLRACDLIGRSLYLDEVRLLD